MSLIVLDWDLLGTTSTDEERDDSDEGGASPHLGMTWPDAVRRDPKADSRRFVHKLMDELYCPIFIISNVSVPTIWEQLEKGLDSDETQQLKARVLVRSKKRAKGALLAELNQWIGQHPAIYGLEDVGA